MKLAQVYPWAAVPSCASGAPYGPWLRRAGCRYGDHQPRALCVQPRTRTP